MGEEHHDRINLAQGLIISFAGIFAGIIPITIYSFFFPQIFMMGIVLAYILGISLDLHFIQMILVSIGKKKMPIMKTSIYEMNEDVWIRYRKNVKGK